VKPNIILADEPTGALDTQTGEEILDLFAELNEQGITIITITHDPEVAERAHRTIWIRDGLIVDGEGH
jgi:putative ABC transport system ATP-binding protein